MCDAATWGERIRHLDVRTECILGQHCRKRDCTQPSTCLHKEIPASGERPLFGGDFFRLVHSHSRTPS